MAYNYPIEPETRVSDIFFRTISGFFGGGFGTLVLLISILLSSSFESLSYLSVESGVVHPFFTFLVVVAVYVALLISSLVTLTFFYYTNRDRYHYLLSGLTHAFVLVTVIFLISMPLSILLSVQLQSFDALGIVSLILMGVTVVFSVISFEVIANSRHLLLTLYSSAVALFFFFFLMLVLYVVFATTTYLIVIALPLIWGGFGFWQASMEMIYQWLFQVYGVDFLHSKTRVGSDYIKEQRLNKQ